MTCQRCDAAAIVHLTETVHGKPRVLHLCRACAARAGLPVGPAPEVDLDAVIQKLVLAHVGELVGAEARATCPDCGLNFMEFRVAGRLGCPNDYATFASGLLPLLRRAHGASRHVGKRPKRARAPGDRLRLRGLLRKAVAREDYEEAARLRDRLRQEDQDA